MEVQSEDIFNMPDLLFAQLCDERYQINKGVLNVIDLWFYKRGLKQITDRRKTILSFFHYMHNSENTGKKVRFGPGGLTNRLEKFWKHQDERGRKVVQHA